MTPRLPRAAEAARRKIRGRRRWYCDYAKNLPAELRWTDTLEGASDASHPQLRSYATLARAVPLSLRVIVTFMPVVCSKCRRCCRRVRHRHPVVVRRTAITQQYTLAQREKHDK